MFTVSLVLLLCGSVCLTLADSVFQYPPANGIQLAKGQTIIISWTTDWSASDPISLIVWQNVASMWASETLLSITTLVLFIQVADPLANVPDPKSLMWTVRAISDNPSPRVIHFNVKNNARANTGFNSGNLTVIDGTPVGTSTFQVTSTRDAGSMNTSIPTSASPPSSSPSAKTSGLSASAKVGLGAGLGLGIPLLVFVVGSLLIAYRRFVQKRGDAAAHSSQHVEKNIWVDTQQSKVEKQQIQQGYPLLPAELPT